MGPASWLGRTELRIGLGCMRLATDEPVAIDTIAAAAGAGLTVFDTARAYGPDPAALGHNERWIARALRAGGWQRSARIVTKGGMTRPGGRWVPDGRAKAIAADCQASLTALDGLPIDLYLLHAPDPRTPWRTSVRALARLVEQGLVRRVGLANVTRTQLDQALELAPIAAVQVALSPFDDHAVRGGVLARCTELGLALIAHSPLGGPRRASALARRPELTRVAARHGSTEAEAALAWLLALSPLVVAIPGAGKPQSARSAARAAALRLSDDDRDILTAAFGGAQRASPGGAQRASPGCAQGASPGGAQRASRGGVHRRLSGSTVSASAQAESPEQVVIVMGIPGAGKSRLAAGYVQRGYARLNRDERGGSLRAMADELEKQLAAGLRQAVLDNTYLTRAVRNRVLEAGERHSVAVRCVWVDTPLAQAQVNLVERLLERFGLLPTPQQVRDSARREPWLMLPTSQMRALRELEPPSLDEGFSAVERVPFVRAGAGGGRPGVLVGAAATAQPGIRQALADADRSAPHLLFDWTPGGDASALGGAAGRLADLITGPLEVAVCPHPGGPPRCWCRPPLPGLPLAFAKAHSVDLARSIMIGCSPAHRTLASTLGARYLPV